MPYIYKKGSGQVIETGFKDIPLKLTKENLKELLTEIINQETKYTHQDFANWCRTHFSKIISQDIELEEIGIDEATYEVIMDVDAQWDLYLVNTFKIDELKELDLTKVHLPLEWFKNWLKQLEQ
ncbi:hypothetical protein AHMF7605_11430 [Adhaeribacter arboris]|uniref:Uncharacterized protein n=1 Tax=Adhaeribacter arboris TaxID=2072846 RepID=A0A2T2YF50_9BACT|nr:hypothetical protein [Adhaeribacter arboris]PSR54088.1 hypothetical protein AHMF7605_11430 [Adhaeribacter arboris]